MAVAASLLSRCAERLDPPLPALCLCALHCRRVARSREKSGYVHARKGMKIPSRPKYRKSRLITVMILVSYPFAFCQYCCSTPGVGPSANTCSCLLTCSSGSACRYLRSVPAGWLCPAQEALLSGLMCQARRARGLQVRAGVALGSVGQPCFGTNSLWSPLARLCAVRFRVTCAKEEGGCSCRLELCWMEVKRIENPVGRNLRPRGGGERGVLRPFFSSLP